MNKFLLLCVCLFSTSLQAWNCKYEKNIEQVLDLTGSEMLIILAGAGDLEIEGDQGRFDSNHSRTCLRFRRRMAGGIPDRCAGRPASGNRCELPEISDSWSLMGQTYAYIDLEIDSPETVFDWMSRTARVMLKSPAVDSVHIKDSSGDILIEDIGGSVTLSDSSGDIVLSDIEGDVTVESDSSGDIRGRDVEGSVLISRDSSGDIRFTDIGRDFTVERDSSGDITAKRCGRRFYCAGRQQR